jgi:hypothetical protein
MRRNLYGGTVTAEPIQRNRYGGTKTAEPIQRNSEGPRCKGYRCTGEARR